MGVHAPVHRQRCLARNRDLAAQAVHRQALDQIIRELGLAIEQQTRRVGPDQKIEQVLALRAEQRSVAGQWSRGVIGDEALKEGGGILAFLQGGEADQCAGGQMGFHSADVGMQPLRINHRSP